MATCFHKKIKLKQAKYRDFINFIAVTRLIIPSKDFFMRKLSFFLYNKIIFRTPKLTGV